ncbi:MFS general substrate transporter [Suhomyces tanzawaensis NRRL Y-17324]|uniref:MFS general substrate transporter n=1 Tax=Suhomyces tanzawaensis NRRL Y-17324 TaxID=984487 RepID=A0A1E4SEI8_9ASCO|nr:MFS general substrate transporter [Suhomyces tanzawaensis NRRL Y-17324]ODV77890.1 MFS general substrate transporter [Suhomyces tanzawaensis NRRL Y-17324]
MSEKYSAEMPEAEAPIRDELDSSKVIDSASVDENSITSDPQDIDQKKLDRIYRKLDYRIIPALWCMYFLTSFGGGAYGNTLVMNRDKGHSLSQHLRLSRKDLSTASALYYVGYIVFDVPMNLIMTKVSPQSWLARIVITVGLVYTCYSSLSNPGGLKAVRFISGMVGAGTWPGMSYYISLWYPNERITRRIGYYFTATQISVAVGGLVGAGVQHIDGNRGYTGWQWMYLIYGVITMTVGVSLLWWLPDRPFKTESESTGKLSTFYNRYFTTSHPLNEEEKAIHQLDIKDKQVVVKWGYKEVFEIITDLRIWPIIIMYFGVVGCGIGIDVFAATIITTNNPKLTDVQVNLLVAPIWLFDLAGILIMTPLADKFKKFRPVIFSFGCCIIMAGLFIMTYAHGPWKKYSGMLISGFGLGPTVPICMSWSNEIFSKRYGDVGSAVSAALVSGFGSLGSVTVTRAFYSSWPADVKRQFHYSNMMLVMLLGVSIMASGVTHFLKDRIRQVKN